MITRRGWAQEILAKQNPAGWWVSEESLYQPKYLSTNWMLLILADLGLTKADPRIKKACDLWIERFAKDDGGFSMDGSKKGHLCVTGNTTRALVQFGYADHPAVRGAFGWLVKNGDKNGGWSCFWGGRDPDPWGGWSGLPGRSTAGWGEGAKGGGGAGGEDEPGEEMTQPREQY